MPVRLVPFVARREEREDGLPWGTTGGQANQDETVARTEQDTDAAVTVAIATVIMVMMVTLLLVHALA